jgi:hypothetical protein
MGYTGSAQFQVSSSKSQKSDAKFCFTTEEGKIIEGIEIDLARNAA